MASNFKTWVDTPTPGQQTQSSAVFSSDPQRANGFLAGDPASAIRVNSALRQANVVVAALMALADKLKTLPGGLDLNSKVSDIQNALEASIVTPLTTRLDDLEEEVASLTGADTSLTSRVGTLESNMSQAQSDIDNLEEEIANLTGGSSTLTQRIDTLEDEMDTAQSDINAIESKNTKQDASISGLTTRMSTAEDDINTLQSDVANAEGRLDELEAHYERDVATSNWSGSAGNYTFLISASTHGRGTRPRVFTYISGEQTFDSPTIDFNTGNVTLHSNARVALKVLIY